MFLQLQVKSILIIHRLLIEHLNSCLKTEPQELFLYEFMSQSLSIYIFHALSQPFLHIQTPI